MLKASSSRLAGPPPHLYQGRHPAEFELDADDRARLYPFGGELRTAVAEFSRASVTGHAFVRIVEDPDAGLELALSERPPERRVEIAYRPARWSPSCAARSEFQRRPLTRPPARVHGQRLEGTMAFQDDLARHADQIRARLPHIQGEEATKQALVVPFLHVLGYDIFDPREVRPEYVADFATKKQGQFEKVDYAIFLNSVPVLFVECKPVGAELEDHGGQLARYFNATPSVRVAMITNGVQLRVYTDLQTPNVMDAKPWLDIDLRSLKPAEIEALKRFRKVDFTAEEILKLAEEMVYYNAMTSFLAAQMREPSEDFVRFVAKSISVPLVTAKVIERLTPVLKKAVQSVIVEHVARSFAAPTPEPEPPAPPPAPAPEAAPAAGGQDVVTTAEEMAAFETIAGFVKAQHPAAPIAYRDSKGYFTIHQNNIRKWCIRLGLNKPPFWVAVRHVRPDEARALVPGVDAADGGQIGDTRLGIGSVGELDKLRPLLLLAFEREASRVSSDAEA